MMGMGMAAGAAPEQRAPSREAQQEPNVTPEQQQEYNKFVGFSLMTMAQDGFLEKAKKAMEANPSIEDGMAQIGANVAYRVFTKARQEGQTISPAVLVHGGAEIMEKVGEMAGAAGIEVTPEQIEDAYYMAADIMNEKLTEMGIMDEEFAAEDAEDFMAQNSEEVERVRGRVQGVRDRLAQGLIARGNPDMGEG